MSKNALVATPTENDGTGGKHAPLVRVEEDVNDFISLRLPAVAGTSKLEIKKLWTSKDGMSTYFRCNYWHYDETGIVVTRTCIKSSFVKVETSKKGKVLTDLTDQRNIKL